jgi:hypothetical protein
MKKAIFIIAITLFSLDTFSQQQQLNVDNLIGYWRCLDEETTELFFWKSIDGELQVQEVSSSSGKPIDLIRLRINEKSVIIDTVFKPNEWITKSEYTFLNPNELICIISGDANAKIHYTKIK